MITSFLGDQWLVKWGPYLGSVTWVMNLGQLVFGGPKIPTARISFIVDGEVRLYSQTKRKTVVPWIPFTAWPKFPLCNMLDTWFSHSMY